MSSGCWASVLDAGRGRRRAGPEYGKREHVFVHGVESVRQRVDLRHGDGELGVEGMSEPGTQSFSGESEESRRGVELMRAAQLPNDLFPELVGGQREVVILGVGYPDGLYAHRRAIPVGADNPHRARPEGAGENCIWVWELHASH